MSSKKLDSMKKLANIVICNGEGGSTPTGTFAVYVGEDRQRFVVPTSYLSHPLFKIMLEKAYNELGFDQRNGLVLPCSVVAFQEMVNAIEAVMGNFILANW
ncbi:hypothetical protein BUALT_Bualt02G0158200 [Buddleja alternifolia]|uniref:Small auxin up regulated protein n=1 Tax=Buddleja alternifolia TaxID=168488 RepID=A0AAV6Y1A9_9LAMI|nr:hypothetical protein BUALT_Bualt02G0158200 [Buddleja alternifolia]